jgi:hypothetical protein
MAAALHRLPPVLPRHPRPVHRTRLAVEELEPRVALASSLAPNMAAVSFTTTAALGTNAPASQPSAAQGTTAPSGTGTLTAAAGKTNGQSTGSAAAPTSTAPAVSPTGQGTQGGTPQAFSQAVGAGQGITGPGGTPTGQPPTGAALSAAAQSFAAPGLLNPPGNLTPLSAPTATATALVDTPLPYGTTPFELLTTMPPLLLRTLPLYEQPGRDIGMLGNDLTRAPAVDQPATAAPVPLPIPLAVPTLLMMADAAPGDPGGSGAAVAASVSDARAELTQREVGSEVFTPDTLARVWTSACEAQSDALDLPVVTEGIPSGPAEDVGLALYHPVLLLAGWAFLQEGRRDGRHNAEDRERG